MDNLIDAWHDGDSNLPLHEYLGMTQAEYHEWVRAGREPRSTPLRDKLITEGLTLFFEGTGNPLEQDPDEEQPGSTEGT